jgi:hypothetical protein
VQGVQSIVQLKEAYQDVKAVLGFTTVAQNTLTAATTTTTVATNGASVAARGFSAALASTGIGAIVVALGLLAGAFLLTSDATEDDTEAQEKNNAERDKALKLLQDEINLKQGEFNLTSKGTIELQRQVDLIKARGGSAREVFNAEQKLREEELRQLKVIQEAYKNQGVDPKVFAESQTAVLKKQNEIEVARVAFQQQQNEKALENQRKASAESIKIEQDRLKQLEAQYDKEYRDQISKIDEELDLAKSQNAVTFYGDEQARRDADLQAEQSAIDKKLEVLTNFNLQDGNQYKQLVLKREFLSKQLADKETGNNKESNDAKQKADQATYDAYVKLYRDQLKKEEELRQRRIETTQFGLDFASDATDFLVEEAQRESDEKIARLEEERKAGLISEEQYQAGLKKIKQKNAEDTKKAQVFQAILSAAQAILNALTVQPAVDVPRAVAFAAITGAANLAKILATPIPKFQQGTLSVPGQDFGRDSVYAMLRPGEAVIPTETNRAYAPTIEAIYRKRIKPSEINAFVLNRMTGKGSIGRDTAVTASVDTFALSKAMSKQKTVEVGNARTVGKAIAGEILKAYNPRRA